MKFELHAHTFYSNDAIVSPENLVKISKRNGMNGVAVTDHNTTRGWKRALAAGKKHDFPVIRAEEIKVFHEGKKIGEVLGLFLNEEIKPDEFSAVADRIREQDGLLVVAHPFDYFRSHFRMLEEYKKRFDAVEAVNARVVLNWFNTKARQFAGRNGLPVTGGSDSHCMYEVANAYTEADIAGTEDLRKAIRQGKTRAYGKRTNPLIHTLSTLTKLGIMRPKGL